MQIVTSLAYFSLSFSLGLNNSLKGINISETGFGKLEPCSWTWEIGYKICQTSHKTKIHFKKPSQEMHVHTLPRPLNRPKWFAVRGNEPSSEKLSDVIYFRLTLTLRIKLSFRVVPWRSLEGKGRKGGGAMKANLVKCRKRTIFNSLSLARTPLMIFALIYVAVTDGTPIQACSVQFRIECLYSLKDVEKVKVLIVFHLFMFGALYTQHRNCPSCTRITFS